MSNVACGADGFLLPTEEEALTTILEEAWTPGFTLPTDEAADCFGASPLSSGDEGSPHGLEEKRFSRREVEVVKRPSSECWDGFQLPPPESEPATTSEFDIGITVTAEVAVVLNRVCKAVRNLPRHARRLLASCLTGSSYSRRNHYRDVCASLLGISEFHFRKVVQKLKNLSKEEALTPAKDLERGGTDPKQAKRMCRCGKTGAACVGDPCPHGASVLH